MPEHSRLTAITRGSSLRAAINTGNRALVQQAGDVLAGVSPALATRLAEALGLSLAPVIYSGAGAVFADAGADRWDVAFLAIDPIRAEQVSFTRPYLTIEATYAVRATSPITEVAQADREGVEVLTSTGSAYDLYLTKALRHARHIRTGTPSESFEAFRAGTGDVVAGVRQSLERHFGSDPAFRILTQPLTGVAQAMVLPGRDNPLIAALDGFVAEAIACGFVASQTNA